jgi:glutathione S-transferase
MILYGSYTSPFVRHCRIQLAEAGLDYDFVETDYAASDKGSPTKRVPFLRDGELALTDSNSILMHIRQQAGLPFIDNTADMEQFCLAGTALDAAINLFLLEREGQTPENNPYLARQAARVTTTLAALNSLTYPEQPPYSVADIRLACLLDWGLYRKRFSLDEFGQLSEFLHRIRQWPPFADTAPPAP